MTKRIRKKDCNLRNKMLMNSSRYEASRTRKTSSRRKGLPSHSNDKSIHFKQSVGELVDSPISTSECPEPIKPKIKLKTKTGFGGRWHQH